MAKRTQRKDVGAWLGGNRGTVQSRFPSGASDREAQADAGGGQMEQVRAELGLGAYAAGIGAAGAIGAGVAAVKSGAAARAVNKATGKSVVVHGSSVGGLKKIEPRAGSAALPYDKAAFAWNPAAYKSKDGMSGLLWDTRSYTSKSLPDVNELRKGTVYVAKTPTKNLKKIKEASPTPGPLVDMGRVQSFKESGMYTNKPLKVVSSVDVSKYKDSAERAVELAKKIKKAGGKVPKGATKRRSYVVEDDF
jgi:hypothetical protein